MIKVFEPVTKSTQGVSEDVTKTITEPSIENNKARENLNNKFLEIMTDRAIIATYLMSPLSNITNPERTSQFKLVKDLSSNKINNLLKNKILPVTLYNNLLTVGDADKKFELN